MTKKSTKPAPQPTPRPMGPPPGWALPHLESAATGRYVPHRPFFERRKP